MHKVYVGSLSHSVTEHDLHRLFDECGEIDHVWVARRPPGFAFVHFRKPDSVYRAIDRLNGTRFLDTRIIVEEAKEDRGPRNSNPKWRRSPPPPRRYSDNSRYSRDSRRRSRSRSRDRDRSRENYGRKYSRHNSRSPCSSSYSDSRERMSPNYDQNDSSRSR